MSSMIVQMPSASCFQLPALCFLVNISYVPGSRWPNTGGQSRIAEASVEETGEEAVVAGAGVGAGLEAGGGGTPGRDREAGAGQPLQCYFSSVSIVNFLISQQSNVFSCPGLVETGGESPRRGRRAGVLGIGGAGVGRPGGGYVLYNRHHYHRHHYHRHHHYQRHH